MWTNSNPPNRLYRGPLIFCLLLSLLLSMTASSKQKTAVFSGVFALIWIGEAVVTTQIKLLGGNMQVPFGVSNYKVANTISQLVLSIDMHHRLHTFSTGHCGNAERSTSTNYSTSSCIHRANCVVFGCWCQHSWGLRSGEESGWHCCISPIRVLCWTRVLVLY